jgi:TPR repeat protein
MLVNVRSSLWPLLIAGAVAAAHAQPSVSVSEDPAPALECNGAVYRFLPGEVNYCLALKMWEKGDYRRGEAFLLLAAGWGSKPAQYSLGLAYFNGEGVAKDRPLGLAWLTLAAERDDPTFKAVMKSVYAGMPADERGRAEVLYAKLREQYRDDVAAVRAKTRYDREIRAVAGNAAYSPRLCIAGLNSGALAGDVEAVSQSCPPATQAVETLNKMSEQYFKGWRSRVDVGPLQEINESEMRADDPAG